MTEGETRFYLREIHLHWGTSNVSADKLAELQAAHLIEINLIPIRTVRLTSQGARQKNLTSRPATQGGIGFQRPPRAGRARPRSGKHVARARPLV
jgi:hypothetical protein